MMPVLNRTMIKLVLGIACALGLALLVHDRNRWKAKTAHHAEVLAGERAAYAATVANVRAAAEQARAADQANAARVAARQDAINQRSDDDYQDRIADARAAAQRLRGEGPSAAADPGAGRAAGLPGLPPAPQGIAQAAGADRLPDPERLIATEQAIQLDELIKWVQRQHAIPMKGESAERQHAVDIGGGPID
jgi:hypothetical protein